MRKTNFIPNSAEKVTFNKAGAPDLQQAKSVSKQPICKHAGDGDSCKGGDAGAVKSNFFSRIRYNQLDREEQEFLSSFENNEWKSVKNLKKEKQSARKIAIQTLVKLSKTLYCFLAFYCSLCYSQAPTTFVLVRPVQSEDKANDIWSGTTRDPQLTEKGRQEAQTLADSLEKEGFDPVAILSAPFIRSRDSIAPFAIRKNISIIDPMAIHLAQGALNENSHGILTGMTKEERDQVPSWVEYQKLDLAERYRRPMLNDDPAVMSMEIFTERFVETLKSIAAVYSGKTVILSLGGGGPINGLQKRAWLQHSGQQTEFKESKVSFLVIYGTSEWIEVERF